MRQHSCFKKASVFALLLIASRLTTFAQCGPIAEPFTTLNSMMGFSSTTQGSAAPGFVWSTNGQNGYLERCAIEAIGSTYFIQTPTYQTAASQTDIGVGFELDGVVNASQVNIEIQFSLNGSLTSVLIATVNPVYAANHADICVSVPINTIPGYTAGTPYRFNIAIVSSVASNSNQCIRFDNFRTTGTASQIILPVNFVNVTARLNGREVEISWMVSGEKEVNRYEVEKSTDSRNFATAGEVSTNRNQAYSFIDKNAGNGLIYYRIRSVDNDGKFAYSKIVRMNLSKTVKLNVFPQPAQSEINIEHGLTLNGKISIVSTTGQVLKTIEVKPGFTQTTINISELKQGWYVVRFDNGKGEIETLKMIRQ